MRLRRFMTAFVCLSTLALAQNVVAGTSTSETGSHARSAEIGYGETPHIVRVVTAGGEAPAPATMMFFVCGFAGLTAAGGRRPVQTEEEVA